MHAKLAKDAKVISERNLLSDYMQEQMSNSRLYRSIRNADRNSQAMIYALAKGYDVVQASNGYHMVINRKALVLSDTTF